MDNAQKMKTIIFHIGWMRTGTTYMQYILNNIKKIDFSLKNRYFSYDEYYNNYSYMDSIVNNDSPDIIHIDSDENYSLGRFKKKIIKRNDYDFRLRGELDIISHDIPKMIKRLYTSVPSAKIFGIIRRQDSWLKSIYKHDVESFGIDLRFDHFMKSDLGKSYMCSGDYLSIYNILRSYFGEDNIKILLFEDIIHQPEMFFSELSDFCGTKIVQQSKTKKNKNASLADLQVEMLRNINRFSRKNPHKSEHDYFWFMRSNAVRLGRFLSTMPLLNNYQLKGVNSKKLMEPYGSCNKKLSNIIQKESQMKEYGYY